MATSRRNQPARKIFPFFYLSSWFLFFFVVYANVYSIQKLKHSHQNVQGITSAPSAITTLAPLDENVPLYRDTLLYQTVRAIQLGDFLAAQSHLEQAKKADPLSPVTIYIDDVLSSLHSQNDSTP